VSLVIYGVHPVEEVLAAAADKVSRVFAKDWDAPRLAAIRKAAEDAGVRREVARGDELDRLADGGNHQGVAARLSDFEYATLNSLLEATEDASSAAVLVLDGVQDPHNLGALLRTASALGAAGVIIPKDRAAGVTPAVIRASAGLALRVPVIQVTNIARTLGTLAENGWWSVAAVMDGDDAWDVDMVMKAAIVMGGEGDGVRRLVEETCDFRARIPIGAHVESLNVSVAGALMLYEWARQNRTKTA
jgi:23S rRNA (guanosine2251-2'-O)-methyltransferase